MKLVALDDGVEARRREIHSRLKNENVFGFVNNENRIDVNVAMKDDDGCTRTKRYIKCLHDISSTLNSPTFYLERLFNR